MGDGDMERIHHIRQKLSEVLLRYPRLLLMGVLGLLLMMGSPMLESEPAEEAMTEAVRTDSTLRTEEAVWEDKLKRILSAIDGAGEVEVIVQIEEEKRIEHEKNRTHEKRSMTEGKSGAVTIEEKITEELPMQRENGTEMPVISRALRPSVKGVLVIAEGGTSSAVRADIRDAVRTATGVPSYRVKVLAKKREGGIR
ncbi:MAG: hypothetical protein J6B02_02220 [Selenomonadales bacterium]|nr:hypothetical protein [Selenomonadales bacterium]